MLVETFEYAVNNREQILSRIDFEEHESILRKARGLWTDYDPSGDGGSAKLVGIDSSWNFVPYQGFYIYAVDAVSILGDGTYLVPPLFEVNLSTLSVKSGEEYVSSPQLALESIGMDYEFEQTRSCIGKADYILVDGSVLARYYDRKRKKESSFHETARELTKQEGILYISKKSFSDTALRGGLGDMFYFNRVSPRTGLFDAVLGQERGHHQLSPSRSGLALHQAGDTRTGGEGRHREADGHPGQRQRRRVPLRPQARP